MTTKPDRSTLGGPTGSPGPGPSNGGVVDFRETGVNGVTYETFGCKVFKESPKTPDWRTASVHFERKVFTSRDVTMPDAKKTKVRFWGFEDPLKAPGVENVPGPLMRVTEDQIVHVLLKTSKGPHTIHHHAIEPTTMNDGVGHVSMEVGEYIYQWQPRQAGTYFYHCHRNTVLHFEMGMFGLLVVDPAISEPYRLATGKRLAYHPTSAANMPEYHTEQAWVFDDIDPVWHQMSKDIGHDAGLCGDDVGLNNFNPKFFMINGEPRKPKKKATDALTPIAKAGVVAWEGDKILLRLLNASYSLVKVTLPLEAQLISVDGHSLNKPWNSWVTYKKNQPFFLTTANRYEMLIDLKAPANSAAKGTLTANFEFQHWVKRTVHNAGDLNYEGTASTTITIV